MNTESCLCAEYASNRTDLYTRREVEHQPEPGDERANAEDMIGRDGLHEGRGLEEARDPFGHCEAGAERHSRR